MTPRQADMELWLAEPAIRYATKLLLTQLEKSVSTNLFKTGRIANVWITDAGSLVIDQSFAR